MATIRQQLEEQIARLQQQLAEITSRYEQDRVSYQQLVTDRERAQQAYNSASPAQQTSATGPIVQLIAADRQLRNAVNPDSIYPEQIDVLEIEINQLARDLEVIDSLQPPSSGEIVDTAQQTNSENANPQNPRLSGTVVDATGPRPPLRTNAEPTLSAESGSAIRSSGDDAPVRRLTQTQNSRNFEPGSSSGTAPLPDGVTIPPAVSSPDDRTNPTRSRITDLFATNVGTINPQPNALSKYASYTYQIGIYLLSPEDYKYIIENKRPLTSSSQLLISTGGAPVNADPGQAQVGATSSSAGRNQFFPLDYYLDDVTIQQLLPGKGTRSSNNTVSVSFRLTEPNGITFLDNLYAAVDNYIGRNKNYAAQTYLMVIKFYGYDSNGKLVIADNAENNTTDAAAIIEKYIPFQFTNISFRIANQLVEYRCEAVCPQYNIGTGQARGVIPYNVESSASTLGELFGSASSGGGLSANVIDAISNTVNQISRNINSAVRGIIPTASTKAPPKADAASSPVISQGIVEVLNEFERQKVESGIQDIEDEYEVVFTDNIIEQASTIPPGEINKSLSPTVLFNSAAQLINPAAQKLNTEVKKVSAVAGTTLVQFLDQAIRNSTYIYDQQTQVYDTNGELIQQNSGTGASVMAWYRIGVQAVPKGWDSKRLDYAYKITYQINPYAVNDLQSEYFPQTKFRGVHKRYAYWFTGENTEVLNYQQDFNYLYYIVVNGNQVNNNVVIDARELPKRLYQTRSGESSHGQSGKVNEPGANAAERLYSPSDLARAKMTILGDPAWIQQGEVWRGISGPTLSFDPFYSDGSINFEIQEPLFEIAFNKPGDYNLASGRQDPWQRDYGANRLTGLSGEATQSYIYRAVSVTSTLSKGRFTQDLEGMLVTFPVKYNPTPEETESFFVETEEETDRLLKLVDQLNRTQNSTISDTRSAVAQIADPEGTGNADNPEAQVFVDPLTSAPSSVPSPPTTESGQILESSAEVERFSFNFSKANLLSADPVFAKEFFEYEQQRKEELYQQQYQSLLSQAERSPFYKKPLDSFTLNRLQTTARNYAEDTASSEAVKQYREKLLQYGPSVYKDNLQTSTVNPSIVPPATANSAVTGTITQPIVRGSSTQNINKEY